MPTTGTRAVMPRPYELTVETYDVPEPGAGEVLVQSEASAISAGTELAVYTGVHQWLNDPTRTWPRFPFVPGYSGVGRIVAVGADVTTYAAGDRVIWPARHETHSIINVNAPHAMVARIADHVPAQVAAFVPIIRFPLTALVQSGALLGQSVAVLGQGTIGQIALRLFAAAGAYPLIGIDPVAARREVSERTAGVSTLGLAEGDEMREQLRAINGGALPDIVVEATGNPQAVKLAMHIVESGGKVIMVGSPRGIAGDVDFYWDLHGRSIQLIGAHGSAIGNEPREKFPFTQARAVRLIIHMLESGKLKIDDLITHFADGHELKPVYDGLLNARDEYLAVAVHW